MTDVKENLKDAIARLILIERAAQVAKWGKQNLLPHEWLMVLNEEMGELAKELWENRDRKKQLTEAVQVIAMGVQICEWVSERLGWTNDSAAVLDRALSGKQLHCTWTTHRLYLKMTNEVGAVAFAADQYSDNSQKLLSDWTRHCLNLIWLGTMLIVQMTLLMGDEGLDTSTT